MLYPWRQRDVIGRRGTSLEELESVYRDGFTAFARVAATVTGDPELARDAVQDGFATAVRKRRTFRGDGPLEAWVWRIVLNAARSQARRRRPEPNSASNSLLQAHLGAGEGTNGTAPDPVAAELRVALALLPERQRLAVFLRYYADLDYDGIATALGVKPGTVAATLHAAHAALRGRLEEVRT
jgi:RNA polymerase sigma-70 factor (ECF subfamily)